MKRCITWEDAEFLIKAYKKIEEEWKKSHISKKFLDSHGLEHALKVLFEHKGFWVEEENDG